MLVEWIKYLMRPTAPELRALGYLSEAIAVEARWRRCGAAWEPHLAECRAAVSEAIRRSHRRRTAIVLGSGLTLDLPLDELAHAFERVLLVDVLHPPAARRRARGRANVELVAADVTGAIDALYRLEPAPSVALPAPRRLALLDDPNLDLVISLNLLSQLSVLPVAWLDRRLGVGAANEVAGFAQALVAAHLADLERCQAMTCLISDVERLAVTADGSVLERHSTLAEIAEPRAERSWLWRIAPIPEADRRWSEHLRVIAAFDLAKTRSPRAFASAID